MSSVSLFPSVFPDIDNIMAPEPHSAVRLFTLHNLSNLRQWSDTDREERKRSCAERMVQIIHTFVC